MRKAQSTALALPGPFLDLVGKTSIPDKTMMNARAGITRLGISCRYDVFHDRRLIAGVELSSGVGEISDDMALAVRALIRQNFKFDPGKEATWDALNLLCRENSFHPIRDYLDGLKWDGKPRVGTWLVDYMKAPDTEFVRAVSDLTLIASVRRIRKPGTKFDYMTVLESPEGMNKSRALAVLYGADNFTDQAVLGASDKEIMENLRGRWCHESADLAHLRRAEIEKVKAQLSRQTDRARPAYGRALIDVPRSVVQWGSTNDQQYLRSQTGNRRFFPITVGRIDIAALERDRDQLWAEANCLESLGTDIMLPERLWVAAGIEQAERTEADPWADAVADFTIDPKEVGKSDYEITAGEERITSNYLMSAVLGIPVDKRTAETGKRLGLVMRGLGWQGPKVIKISGRPARGYARKISPAREPWE